MVSAPCFEVLNNAASPRRGSLRAWQTLAGKRQSELLRRKKALAMDSQAERAPFPRIFLRCDMFRELALQYSAFTSTTTIFLRCIRP
jgi:hypothetical protein